jgi:TolB-like protein/DNA-binding winged helix-turn-helix (wHTH) protein/Flp pilus assembly protein TadD
VLLFEEYALDLTRRVLLRGRRPVALRPKSFDVLAYLAHNAGRVVTKDELIAAVWPGVVVTDESLTRCVSDIRAALGDGAHRLVKTVPRCGYVLAAPTRDGATGAQARQRRFLPWMLSAWLALFLVAGAWLALAPRDDDPSLSIVVLPLTSRNGNDEQQYLAEAVTEELTVDLSRIPDSFVIGRSTANTFQGRPVDARRVGSELGVRYVLEGSLDRIGDEVRISLQLVDALSGRALWAERFDGEFRDLPALHRRVTGTVAQSLQLRLVEAESERAQRRSVSDAGAHDLALRAWSLVRRRLPADIAAARSLLQQAVARDPQSAFAWSLLAETYSADVGARTPNPSAAGATRAEWLRLGEQAADRAYALEPNRSTVLGARGFILSLQGRGEEALVMVERHLAVNRNDATAWFRLCYTYATLGRQEEAIKACHEAIRLSPRDAALAGFYVVLAAAHLYLGRDDEALAWARKATSAQPTFAIAHSWVASAAANLGEMETARSALAEYLRQRQDQTITSLREEGLCANATCERQRERYYAGLAKAGLPG